MENSIRQWSWCEFHLYNVQSFNYTKSNRSIRMRKKLKKNNKQMGNTFNWIISIFVVSTNSSWPFVHKVIRCKNKFIIIYYQLICHNTDQRICYLFSVFMKIICFLCTLFVLFAHILQMFSSECHILYPFEISRPYFGILCRFDRGSLNIILICVLLLPFLFIFFFFYNKQTNKHQSIIKAIRFANVWMYAFISN